MMTRVASPLAVFALAASCGPLQDAGHTPDPQTTEEAIQEAVIREMMTGGNGVRADVVVCIAIPPAGSGLPRNERADPAPRFLRRFRDAADTVVPGSECGLENPIGRMVHKPSGRLAVLYTAGTPVILGPDTAEVRAGHSRASLIGQSCTYGLVRRAGRWRVVSCRDQIVS